MGVRERRSEKQKTHQKRENRGEVWQKVNRSKWLINPGGLRLLEGRVGFSFLFSRGGWLT